MPRDHDRVQNFIRCQRIFCFCTSAAFAGQASAKSTASDLAVLAWSSRGRSP